MAVYKTPEYQTWLNMRQRCSNPKHPEYHRYGARGITVCDEWDGSFESFLRDMGMRPGPLLSLDRRDNDEGYNKVNCRWVDKAIQSFNQRVGSDNRSGVTGVYHEKQTKRWKAFIRVAGKQITLGRFDDFFEACCTRKSAEIFYYPKEES